MLMMGGLQGPGRPELHRGTVRPAGRKEEEEVGGLPQYYQGPLPGLVFSHSAPFLPFLTKYTTKGSHLEVTRKVSQGVLWVMLYCSPSPFPLFQFPQSGRLRGQLGT